MAREMLIDPCVLPRILPRFIAVPVHHGEISSRINPKGAASMSRIGGYAAQIRA